MPEYRRSAHAVFDLKYHIVWIVKYRHKILRGRLAERARDLIRQTCEARGVIIMRGAVSPDHIHMLVSAPPEEFPELRKQFWGQHLWGRGYFCATVGAVDEKTVQEYIENQKWNDDAEGFKITAPTKP